MIETQDAHHSVACRDEHACHAHPHVAASHGGAWMIVKTVAQRWKHVPRPPEEPLFRNVMIRSSDHGAHWTALQAAPSNDFGRSERRSDTPLGRRRSSFVVAVARCGAALSWPMDRCFSCLRMFRTAAKWSRSVRRTAGILGRRRRLSLPETGKPSRSLPSPYPLQVGSSLCCATTRPGTSIRLSRSTAGTRGCRHAASRSRDVRRLCWRCGTGVCCLPMAGGRRTSEFGPLFPWMTSTTGLLATQFASAAVCGTGTSGTRCRRRFKTAANQNGLICRSFCPPLTPRRR